MTYLLYKLPLMSRGELYQNAKLSSLIWNTWDDNVFKNIWNDCPDITQKSYLQLKNNSNNIQWHVILGGDYVFGTGEGEDSIYNLETRDGLWDDENFKIKNYGEGWLGMANRGKFITLF